MRWLGCRWGWSGLWMRLWTECWLLGPFLRIVIAIFRMWISGRRWWTWLGSQRLPLLYTAWKGVNWIYHYIKYCLLEECIPFVIFELWSAISNNRFGSSLRFDSWILGFCLRHNSYQDIPSFREKHMSKKTEQKEKEKCGEKERRSWITTSAG